MNENIIYLYEGKGMGKSKEKKLINDVNQIGQDAVRNKVTGKLEDTKKLEQQITEAQEKVSVFTKTQPKSSSSTHSILKIFSCFVFFKKNKEKIKISQPRNFIHKNSTDNMAQLEKDFPKKKPESTGCFAGIIRFFSSCFGSSNANASSPEARDMYRKRHF